MPAQYFGPHFAVSLLPLLCRFRSCTLHVLIHTSTANSHTCRLESILSVLQKAKKFFKMSEHLLPQILQFMPLSQHSLSSSGGEFLKYVKGPQFGTGPDLGFFPFFTIFQAALSLPMNILISSLTLLTCTCAVFNPPAFEYCNSPPLLPCTTPQSTRIQPLSCRVTR